MQSLVSFLLALCLRMCGDPVHAEELTQRAFVKAWRGLDAFEGHAAFGTWLHRIAVRVAVDDQRSAWRRRWLTRVPPEA